MSARHDEGAAADEASMDAFFDSLDSSHLTPDPSLTGRSTQPGRPAQGKGQYSAVQQQQTQSRRKGREWAPAGKSQAARPSRGRAQTDKPRGQRGGSQKGWYSSEGPGEPDSLPDALMWAPQRASDRTQARGWQDSAASAAQDMYGAPGSDNGWYTGEDVGADGGTDDNQE